MTLEESIRKNTDLTSGANLVELCYGDVSRKALVVVGPRSGGVWIFFEPRQEDMYSSWMRLRGDTFGGTQKDVARVKVWAAQDPEIMDMFKGAPAASVQVNEHDRLKNG